MDNTILKRINKLRLDRGWSIYRLSNEAGLPQSTIINMFNRETLPSIPTLESICKAFDMTLSEFFSEPDLLDTPDIESFEELYNKLSPSEKRTIYSLMKEFTYQ